MIVVRDASHTSPDACELMQALYDELTPLYGGAIAGAFDPIDFAAPGCAFVLAYDGTDAVGCGALRRIDDVRGEIKRMYVRPRARGHGVSRLVLRALEERACSFGYECVWLETGFKQPEAVGLYDTSGYARIPCFGAHTDDPDSVCFEKRLVP